MKKLLMSVLVIGVTFAMLGAGTFSYFDDTETSTGNTFSAGTIDIYLDPAGGQPVATVEGDLDLKPCQTGWIDITVYNDGTNECDVWKHLFDVVCEENGIVEPEQDYYDDFPDSVNWKISDWITYDMYVTIYDASGAIIWEGWIIEEREQLNITPTIECNWIYLGVIPPGGYMYVEQSYHLQAEVGNWAQSDIMTFSIEFFAQQTVGDPAPDPPTPELPLHGKP